MPLETQGGQNEMKSFSENEPQSNKRQAFYLFHCKHNTSVITPRENMMRRGKEGRSRSFVQCQHFILPPSEYN